jgi:hypothetical protein
VSGIQTVVLKGDPDKAGLYTIMLRIPAHTRIAAHVHQDDRVATVVSGTWYIGYDLSYFGWVPPATFTNNASPLVILAVLHKELTKRGDRVYTQVSQLTYTN